MSTTSPRGGRIATAVLLAPVRAAGWRATAHLAAGLPIATTAFFMMVFFGVLTVGLAVTVVPALLTLVTLAWCAEALGHAQRSRFAAILGIRIELAAPPRSDPDAGRFRRLFDRALSARTGRQVAYHLLSLPLSVFGVAVMVTTWTIGIALTPVVAYGWSLALSPEELAAYTCAGLACLFSAPWLARGLSLVDTWLAERLLGPRRADTLRQRLENLAASRAGAIDAADAERRRIERDLHDGTQQRLTALAMSLGMARESLGDPTDPAAQAIAAAHEEAKQTLAELRSFVRGLHPAVLSDRGLDAALSGLASRSPVPVRLNVSVDRRPSATVESVAYFVVSEALTNISKHARASTVDITARRDGDLLRLTIVDDGRGGAVENGAGTGLRGLRQRIAAVDGTLHLDSPPDEGTTMIVELPCGS
ncbi:sensor histidine kinase [Fodinicola acaciae]|uniref:sensor histidine kinase n=1 Tax=Fodinicola acaciae TaxID=2681555 RepID=UPI0013D411CA|nr:sensor histidine kinase [Fodinicola acaciae]